MVRKGFIKKHYSLMVAFSRASAIAELEYRANIAVKIAIDMIWYVAQLSVFEVLFYHANSISGWTIESARVFTGILFLTDAFWMIFFSENLDQFSEKVRKGDLDLLLVKPVNAQFMMSCQKMSLAHVGNLILSLAWLIFALSQLPGVVEWSRLLLLVILIPCSLAIIYGIRFFFSASALFFTRAENINYVWYQIYKLGTRPDAIYPQWLRYIILSIVPVAFFASVPTRLLINTPDYLLLAAAVVISIVSIALSRLYWNYGLTKYTSASS